MSPAGPDEGGAVVISHVRPQNDQGDGSKVGQSKNVPVNMPKPVVKFYRGEPEALGTTQIFGGILLLSIGIVITISTKHPRIITILIASGITLWSGILYIISGVLSVSASGNPTMGKVKASLGMNIINSLASISGIILTAIEIPSTHYFFPTTLQWPYCSHYKSDVQCLGAYIPWTVYVSVLVFILILFTLMFCINISTSVFACKTVCRSSFNEMHVVIYQTTSLIISDTTKDVPPDSTAALTSD